MNSHAQAHAQHLGSMEQDDISVSTYVSIPRYENPTKISSCSLIATYCTIISHNLSST